MDRLEPVAQDTTKALAQKAFAGLGCDDFCVSVQYGATSWGSRESGHVSVSHGGSWLRIPIAYDERDAPFVCDAAGGEVPGQLVSLADEGNYVACAWASVGEGSPVVGVGVDIASLEDFSAARTTLRIVQLLFSKREHEHVTGRFKGDVAFGYAAAFGAKEAAFKATAAPLRAWYRSHTEELAFEVRHFSMSASGTMRGEERDGAAQRALDAMGIGRIAVHAARVGSLALVVACAIATDDPGRAPCGDGEGVAYPSVVGSGRG